jgi:plasmid rolling circle replication initiator protein Rep
MSKCSEWWQWDLYEINEFMKLKKINLCGYSECPICRKLQLAKARIELRPKFEKLVNDGFKLLHVIFTVPSVTDAELRDTILKMNRAYYKLYKWIAIDKKERFRGTMINVLGAYKALEVTSHYKYVLKDTLFLPVFHQ